MFTVMTRTRKAKYGFKATLHGNVEDVLATADGIRYVQNNFTTSQYRIETGNGMGTPFIVVYSDDETFSTAFTNWLQV